MRSAAAAGREGLRLSASEWVIPVGAGLVAMAVAAIVGRAWLAGTNDPDSANSVLYFQRILAGERLEVTVLTTPKPLLTVVYGACWRLFHDWRALVWLTIVVHGVGVAAATRFASRIAGLGAGVFIAAALIISPAELTEVTHANSLPWAVAGWGIAAVAITASPRRFGIAGLALLLAGLVRTETWLIDAAATLGLAVMVTRGLPGRPSSAASVRSALPLLIAWLALPIQWAHDLLLTGNPLYTLSVPAAYTALVTPSLAPIGPVTFLDAVLARYLAMPVVTGLALIGFAYLLAWRRWEVVVGLATLTLGVIALLGWLAWRAVYVSDRYYEEPALGVLFAAAVGIGALTSTALQHSEPVIRRRVAKGIAAVAAIALAVALTFSFRAAGRLMLRTGELQIASENLERLMPELRQIVQSAGESVPPRRTPEGLTTFDPARVPLFVPGPFLGRIAVELDVSLTRLGDSALAFLSAPPAEVLRPGQAIYHDAFLDGPAATFRPIEVTEPSTLGSLRLMPASARSGAYWLIRVEP